jgi:hypothetical protein
MDTRYDSRAVGVFANRSEAESAILEMTDSGFPMEKISLVGRNADREETIAGVKVHNSIDNKADEGAVAGAVTGGALGGVTGLLVGLGTLAIPGVGPILLAGSLATTVATTLAGTAIGAGGASLLGALAGLGIPDERTQVYSDLIEQGYYLVVIEGSDSQLQTVGEMLTRRGIREWQIYNIASTPSSSSTSHYL